ncbi:MAG TPA: transcription elongation factor GreA [Aggregatilineales bacterium]|nr:transcription elongation factor GreA [Aggregatilineales bacterium]
MSEEQFLTEEGAAELRRELDDLLTVKRPALAAKLKEAIAQGDLSENADYHDAKEQQAFLEGRIQYLESLLHRAKIIGDGAKGGKKSNIIVVGSEVTVQEGSDAPETFFIVGAAEADPRSGKISNESPLGRALLGHKVGDTVKVDAPAGQLAFKVKAIK